MIIHRYKAGACLLLVLLITRVFTNEYLFADTPGETSGYLYRLPTGGRIKGRPAADLKGSTVFASEDRYLYRIDREGSILRRDDLPGIPGDYLSMGVDGTCYVGLRRPRLVAVNSSGGVIWSLGLTEPLAAEPVTGSGGQVYVSTGESLLALDHRGNLLWSEKSGSGVYGQPLIDSRGVLIVPESSGFLQAWLAWGVSLWRFRLAGKASCLAAGKDRLYAASNEGTFAAVSLDGTLIWSRKLPRPGLFITESPEGAAVIDNTGVLSLFSTDGDEILSVSTGIYNPSGLFSLTQGFMAVGGNGSVFQISMEGEVYSRVTLPGTVDKPGIIGQSAIAGGGADWNLYIFAAEAGNSLLQGYWNGPGGSSGSRWNRRLLGGTPAPEPWRNYPDFLLIQALLENRGREGRAQALAIAAEKLSGSSPGNRRYAPFYSSTAVALATETFNSPVFIGERVSNDYPELRLAAVKLLAREAAYTSRGALQLIVENEWHEDIITAAMEGLGRIGADPDGRSCRAIAGAVDSEETLHRGTQLAGAAVKSLLNILEYQGAAPDLSLYRTALSVYRVSPDPDARRIALEILRFGH